MNHFTFQRSVGTSIAMATLSGALFIGGCGSDAGQSPVPESVGESEQAVVGSLCAGPFGRKCDVGEYCNAVKTGLCPGPRQFGVCATRPEICPQVVNPVCGCDDTTYTNSCFAARAGVAVARTGECVRQTCGGFGGFPCPGSGVCVDDPTDDCDPNAGGADCGGICVCKRRELCKRGSHFDDSPKVCACVPDAPPVQCGAALCASGMVCCNASCGICTPPGGVCIQIVCN